MCLQEQILPLKGVVDSFNACSFKAFITFCICLIFNQLQFTYLKAFKFIVSVFLQLGTCTLKKHSEGFSLKTLHFHKNVPQLEFVSHV